MKAEDVSSLLLLREDVGENYENVVRSAAAAVGAESCGLALYDAATGQLIARKPRYDGPEQAVPRYRFDPSPASRRVLDTGEAIDGPGLILQKKSRALQPIAPLLADAGTGLAKTLANRVIHPPGKRHLAASLAAADGSIAAGHGVSPEAQALLRAERYEDFLAARARELEDHLGRFLAARLRLDEPDRPSIASLLVADPP